MRMKLEAFVQGKLSSFHNDRRSGFLIKTGKEKTIIANPIHTLT
jgi:hypothetical protein